MFFERTKLAPPDPVFGLLGAFTEDQRKEKVNLMVGIYRNEELKAEILPSVAAAQERIPPLMADYLPIDGLMDMGPLIGEVLFDGRSEQELYTAHVTGGTGALRILAELVRQEIGRAVYLPDPTWPNHRQIFEQAGLKVETYPYYNRTLRGFDLAAFLSFIKTCPKRSVVLLHACCHNPTGSDPTFEEWRAMAEAMRKQECLPLFDCAYQGLGDGLDADAAAIRLFLKEGLEMLIAYSCSKNFSMYSQRVGVVFTVTRNGRNVASHIKRIIRSLYSNPPAFGAYLVRQVLQDEDLKRMWQGDLMAMRKRLHEVRETLAEKLHMPFLRKHKGMFSYIDLDAVQVKRMRDQFAIYMTENGRISMAGLSHKNIDYVIQSLRVVCGAG